MDLKIMSFWAINDSLNADDLNRQMDEMRRLGLDGVVFHPRFYPGNPDYLSREYMDILSDVILHAKETGMEFWLYDEDGWPSGTAGGQVMENNPHFRVRMLREDMTVIEEPGVSPIEKGPAEEFIRLTHERYAQMLRPEAFEYVTGFFTDEVGFGGHGSASTTGMLPWCEDMPEKFRTKELFEDLPGSEEIRAEYWEYLVGLLQERFYQPILKWCRDHGKIYTGHLKGEENPYFQVCHSGSAISSLKGFDLPGIDALERYVPHSFFARLPASVSLQFGDGHAMCEAMGGSGWGTSPRDEEEYLMKLAEQGIDTFIMHIQQFRLNDKALTDWPPSRPCDLSWSEAYPEMIRRVKERAKKIDARRPADALVIVPARGAMAGFLPSDSRCMNDHSGDELPDVPAARDSIALLTLTDALHDAGWLYDLTDEATYEREAAADGESVRVGKRAYANVIMAAGAKMNASAPGTPAQSGWRIVEYEGERRVPSECRKKDDAHFLCRFDGAGLSAAEDSGNLIASGYGFSKSVTLEKTLVIGKNIPERTMLLTGIDGAAAAVSVDGQLAGYAYGPDWSLNVPAMEAGEHVVSVRLMNSGFNVYGPHHYYLGDYKLVSPLHIKGVKHFGDRPDAPENTHVPEWHFVNYRLFGAVHLLNKPLREE